MCTPAYSSAEGLQQGSELNADVNSVGGRNLTTVNAVNVTQNNLDNQVQILSVNDCQSMFKMMQGISDKMNINQLELKQEFDNLRKENLEIKIIVENLKCQVNELKSEFNTEVTLMKCQVDKVECENKILKADINTLSSDYQNLLKELEDFKFLVSTNVKEIKSETKVCDLQYNSCLGKFNLLFDKMSHLENLHDSSIADLEIVKQRNKQSKEFENGKQQQLAMLGELTNLTDKFNAVQNSEKYRVADKQSFGRYHSVEEIVNELEKEEMFFDGLRNGIHPMEFVRQIESKFDFVGTIEDSVKLRIVRQCFRLEPRDWIRDNVFETYSEFKATFIETYWGFKEQAKLHKKIYCGKFVTGRKLSMSAYIKRIHRDAQFLSYSIPETILLQNLIGHLPIDFRMVLINVELSIKSVLDLLSKAEELKLV